MAVSEWHTACHAMLASSRAVLRKFKHERNFEISRGSLNGVCGNLESLKFNTVVTSKAHNNLLSYSTTKSYTRVKWNIATMLHWAKDANLIVANSLS